jgi:hypothetical protein
MPTLIAIAAALLLFLIFAEHGGLRWLGSVLRLAFAPQLAWVSWAVAYLVETLVVSPRRWVHRRVEARFGKRVADEYHWRLVLVAIFGFFAVYDFRMFISGIVASIVLGVGLTLAFLALVSVFGIVSLFIYYGVIVLSHVRRWFRWLTTAYLREAPSGS